MLNVVTLKLNKNFFWCLFLITDDLFLSSSYRNPFTGSKMGTFIISLC